MNKYQEGKIYKIVCNITGETYYGSTTHTLNFRLRKHKNDKSCISRNIIERGDYKIELIKDYPCNSLYELEEEESKYIRENECINIIIPHRTKKEWYEDNKEELKTKSLKNYYENKEQKRETQKKYYENNKQELNKKMTKWRQEKITCECGAIITRGAKSQHLKSLKHIKLTQCIIID